MSQFTYPGTSIQSKTNGDSAPLPYSPAPGQNEGPPPPYSPHYVAASQSPNPYPSVPQIISNQSVIQQPPQSIQPVYQYQQVYSASTQNQNLQPIQQYTQVQPQSQPVSYVQQIPSNAQLQPGATYQIVQPINANAYPNQLQGAPLQIVVDQTSNNQHLKQYSYESKVEEEEQRTENKSFNWLYALSCISCLLCCPIGSCSLYLACKASDQYEKKNYLRSTQNQRKSLIFAITAIVIFIIIVSNT